MNADPFRPLPTRSDYEADMEREAMIQRILHQVQTFEPSEPKPRRIPLNMVAYAAALCVVVAWVVVGRM
jgi:type VI protein secretion system component VasF